MNDPRRPSWLALGLVSLAVRALPKGEVRRRYERELGAQLYHLDRRQQALFALNVLLSCRSLRGALIDAGPFRGEAGIMITLPRIPLRCRLNLKHHWVSESLEGSHEHYLICSRCGKEPSEPGSGVPGGLGSFGGQQGGF